MHARKSLLLSNERPWVKTDSFTPFDVSMGSCDGAEIWKLVALFILSRLEKRFGRDKIGLYRDDGLAILKTTSGRLADRVQTDLIKIFNDQGLEITAEGNQKIVHFLDVTFDLTTSKYYPYREPNDDPLYINSRSNHPPSILTQLPRSINNRLSRLSCDEAAFKTASAPYQDALKRSNYDNILTYNEVDSSTTNQRNRSRNIIWFNQPYSRNVKNKIGRKFLSLIDKHFPSNHALYKIFNRNTVKISYSCMPNMKAVINNHNTQIIAPKPTRPWTDVQGCNCRIKNQCPLPGQCLTLRIVYQAEVTTTDDSHTKYYIGMTANRFKERYRNHQKSFRKEKYANETELSNYIWNLKRQKKDFTINWSIIKKTSAFRNG